MTLSSVKAIQAARFSARIGLLPAGRYEMITSIAPPAPDSAGKLIIAADIATESGERELAGCRWRVGQYRCGDRQTAVEFRLPFTVAEGLPAVLRTIETRIFTDGDRSFRIRSLAVRVRAEVPEPNWLPYVVVGECGIHAGDEIRSLENEIGCIAYTPAMDIETGHYGLFLNLVDAGSNGAKPSLEPCLVIEIFSELQMLATHTCERGSNSGGDPVLTFDVTEQSASGAGIELFITATRPAAVSIRGLRVERIAKDKAPSRPPSALSAKQPAQLDTKTASLRSKGGVLARASKAVAHIEYIQRPFPPGRYEAILTVARAGADGAPAGQITIRGGGKVLATNRIEFAPLRLGSMQIPRGPFRIFNFEVPANLLRGLSGIQIRIESIGAGPFRVHDIVVKPKTPARELRDKAYAAASRTFKRIQAALGKTAE